MPAKDALKNVEATTATTVNVVPNPAVVVRNLVVRWQQLKQLTVNSEQLSVVIAH